MLNGLKKYRNITTFFLLILSPFNYFLFSKPNLQLNDQKFDIPEIRADDGRDCLTKDDYKREILYSIERLKTGAQRCINYKGSYFKLKKYLKYFLHHILYFTYFFVLKVMNRIVYTIRYYRSFILYNRLLTILQKLKLLVY